MGSTLSRLFGERKTEEASGTGKAGTSLRSRWSFRLGRGGTEVKLNDEEKSKTLPSGNSHAVDNNADSSNVSPMLRKAATLARGGSASGEPEFIDTEEIILAAGRIANEAITSSAYRFEKERAQTKEAEEQVVKPVATDFAITRGDVTALQQAVESANVSEAAAVDHTMQEATVIGDVVVDADGIHGNDPTVVAQQVERVEFVHDVLDSEQKVAFDLQKDAIADELSTAAQQVMSGNDRWFEGGNAVAAVEDYVQEAVTEPVATDFAITRGDVNALQQAVESVSVSEAAAVDHTMQEATVIGDVVVDADEIHGNDPTAVAQQVERVEFVHDVLDSEQKVAFDLQKDAIADELGTAAQHVMSVSDRWFEGGNAVAAVEDYVQEAVTEPVATDFAITRGDVTALEQAVLSDNVFTDAVETAMRVSALPYPSGALPAFGEPSALLSRSSGSVSSPLPSDFSDMNTAGAVGYTDYFSSKNVGDGHDAPGYVFSTSFSNEHKLSELCKPVELGFDGLSNNPVEVSSSKHESSKHANVNDLNSSGRQSDYTTSTMIMGNGNEEIIHFSENGSAVNDPSFDGSS